MVSKKGKRKLVYRDSIYYWFVRVDEKGHRVHIMSEDKKLHLEYSVFDTEVPITPSVIVKYLEDYLRSNLELNGESGNEQEL